MHEDSPRRAASAPATQHHVFENGAPSLRKDTLYQQAYEALKRAIMSGSLRPGRSVSLRSLASELGVSPMPVRDALNRLVTQRALELLPNRSVRVPLLTRREFEELTEVRCYLERRMAKDAAAVITKETITQLVAINAQMRDAAKRQAVEEFLDRNFDFHFLLYRASGSEVMLSISESLWLQAGPLLNEYIRRRGFLTASKHHNAIVAALRAGQADRAGKEIEADIRDAARAAVEILDAAPPLPQS